MRRAIALLALFSTCTYASPPPLAMSKAGHWVGCPDTPLQQLIPASMEKPSWKLIKQNEDFALIDIDGNVYKKTGEKAHLVIEFLLQRSTGLEKLNGVWLDKIPTINLVGMQVMESGCRSLHSQQVTEQPPAMPAQAAGDANTTPAAPQPPAADAQRAISASFPNVTVGDVRNWLGGDSVPTFSEPQDVVLTNKERALLVLASYDDQGRNGAQSVVLVVPGSKQAKVLDGFQIAKVMDLDGDGVSEVELAGSASGQGSTNGTNKLVHINGTDLIELLSTDSGDNLGDCGAGSANPVCTSTEVKWAYVTSDSGIALMQTITTSKGKNPDHLKSKTITTRYALRDNKMQPVQ